jgi:hypothetical protein
VETLFPLDRLGEEVTVAKSMGFHTMVKPVVIVGGYRNPNHTNWQRIDPADPGVWFSAPNRLWRLLAGVREHVCLSLWELSDVNTMPGFVCCALCAWLS